MITLPVEYFPYLTGILAVISVLFLIRGWHRGFLFQIIDLATFILTIFMSWPIARGMAGLFTLFDLPSLTSWQNFLLNQVCWFLISVFALKIIFSLIYAIAGVFRKIRIFGFLDRIAGLLLSAVGVFAALGLFGIFLQMPFVVNGAEYVEESPLKIPVEYSDRIIDLLSKGDVSFETLRDAITQ